MAKRVNDTFYTNARQYLADPKLVTDNTLKQDYAWCVLLVIFITAYPSAENTGDYANWPHWVTDTRCELRHDSFVLNAPRPGGSLTTVFSVADAIKNDEGFKNSVPHAHLRQWAYWTSVTQNGTYRTLSLNQNQPSQLGQFEQFVSDCSYNQLTNILINLQNSIFTIYC